MAKNVKKCPKNSKFLVEKYIKVLKFITNVKTILNKGTKHKKIVWNVETKK